MDNSQKLLLFIRSAFLLTFWYISEIPAQTLTNDFITDLLQLHWHSIIHNMTKIKVLGVCDDCEGDKR